MEYTLTLTEIIVASIALVVSTIIIAQPFRKKTINNRWDIKGDELECVVGKVFDALASSMEKKFHPVMVAFEQMKKENTEMRATLKSRQVGIAKLGRDGKLVASIGIKTVKKPSQGSTLYEFAPVKKKRKYDTSEKAKAKRRLRMRVYRARKRAEGKKVS